MGSRNLPVNVDSAYADDATHPDVKVHQQHHDVVHEFVNLWDDAAPGDGFIPFYNDSNGLWEYIDPEIAGSPGPQGDPGVGFTVLGAWNSGTTYHIFSANSPESYEVVTHLGNTYYALATHSNSEPTVDVNGQGTASANWGVLAVRGSDGADGANGATGQTGPIGPQGAPGPTAESAQVGDHVTGTKTLDAATTSMYSLILDDDTVFTLSDSLSRAGSAITLRLYMGAGGPSTATFNTVTLWATDDGLAPDLSGMSTGDVVVIVFDQMAGTWFGYVPAVPAPPAPDTYGTLGDEELAIASDTAAKAGDGTYVLGASVQVGNKRGGVAAVVTTRGDSVAPAVPSLAGGGATTWYPVDSVVFAPVGTTQRRLTLFACRDAVALSAASFTVTLNGVVTDSYTGCAIKVHRTTDIVPPEWLTQIQANFSHRAYNDTSEVGIHADLDNAPLGSPNDTNSRPIAAIAYNLTTDPTFTWDANYAEVGTRQTMSSPSITLLIIFNATAWNTTPGGDCVTSVQWGLVAAEELQG
jgi:hypothetical protein